MKIVIMDGHAMNPGDLSWDFLKEFGTVTYYDRTFGEALTIERIGDADIILLNKTPITDSILAGCPNLKLICILATGYNVVDCDAAARRGVRVCNVPGYSTDSVASTTTPFTQESGQPARIFAIGKRPRWSWLAKPWVSLVTAASEKPSAGSHKPLECVSLPTAAHITRVLTMWIGIRCWPNPM